MSDFIRLFKTRMAAARQDPALKYALRPVKYDAMDGSRELGQGAFILCCALSCYLSFPGDWLMPWRSIVAILLMICGVLAVSQVPRAIKKHVTWPRSGYANTRKGFAYSWTGTVLILLVAFAVCFGMLHFLRPAIHDVIQHQSVQPGLPGHDVIGPRQELFLGGFGVLSALMYVQLSGVSFGKHPWKWLLLAIMAAGPVGIVLLTPGNFIERSKPVLLFVGLIWLASGAATLRSYLRNNPPPTPEAV